MNMYKPTMPNSACFHSAAPRQSGSHSFPETCTQSWPLRRHRSCWAIVIKVAYLLHFFVCCPLLPRLEMSETNCNMPADWLTDMSVVTSIRVDTKEDSVIGSQYTVDVCHLHLAGQVACFNWYLCSVVGAAQTDTDWTAFLHLTRSSHSRLSSWTFMLLALVTLVVRALGGLPFFLVASILTWKVVFIRSVLGFRMAYPRYLSFLLFISVRRVLCI